MLRGGRAIGLYYTNVNSFLTAGELAYIVNNSLSKVLITSRVAARGCARGAARMPQGRALSDRRRPGRRRSGQEPRRGDGALPATPIADESLGAAMLYSSGTTGSPKGVLRPLHDQPPAAASRSRGVRENAGDSARDRSISRRRRSTIRAPLVGVAGTIRLGGTVIVMERFDAEEFLRLVEQYRVTHTQLVPTMFSRMLKLPEGVRRRYDLSSLEAVVHAAAPCPVPVKQAMIDWWGPIILEYYGATEGHGLHHVRQRRMAAHQGTVGKTVLGELARPRRGDAAKFRPARPASSGSRPLRRSNISTIPVKTAEANSPDRTMSTVGDIGHVDEDGYVYLTDRAAFMIISGGVNIYPQECENLLITHPKVADAAVFGVPNEEMGEEVKAVVQLDAGVEPGAETGGRTDRVLPRASRAPQMSALDRFRGGAAAPADRQALQGAPCANATGRGTKAGIL